MTCTLALPGEGTRGDAGGGEGGGGAHEGIGALGGGDHIGNKLSMAQCLSD